MNLIYGALLLWSAGKEISEENVKKIATATGTHVEEAQIKALVSALDGVDIKQAIEKAAIPVAVAAAPVSAGPFAEKAEESEEDKEKKAEEAAEGLSALFG